MHVIVHGGAGAAPDDPTDRQTVLDRASAAGAREGTPTDAVVAAVSRLEEAPKFNAGVGGAIQSDGAVRTDAGIMTSDRDVGGACGMAGVRDAVSVARLVMTETPHVLLSGAEAVSFADSFDIDTEVCLLTEANERRWANLDPPAFEAVDEQLEWVRERFGEEGDVEDRGGVRSHDTVGAVAVAEDGTTAAATSTGGRWCALAGRVGDVPQTGSGFFCARAGGASATGAGEDIVRTTLSRRAVDHLETGHGPRRAAELAIEEFGAITGSDAGVIVADREGETGSAFNSDAMQVSRATDATRGA